MAKALLVGKVNESLERCENYLSVEFQVQLCSEVGKNVKDMIAILRPAVIVFNIMEVNDNTADMFKKIEFRYDYMPIIIITDESLKSKLDDLLTAFKKVEYVFNPVEINSLIRTCYKILELEGPVEEYDENKLFFGRDKRKILVVDDSALVLRNIKEMLEKRYEVILVNSGERAIDAIKTKAPNLVLLDYDMPGMNGKEVFELMKGDKNMKNIPVVFLTSVTEKDQILEVLKNGPEGYLLKPPVKERIIEIIEEVLG